MQVNKNPAGSYAFQTFISRALGISQDQLNKVLNSADQEVHNILQSIDRQFTSGGDIQPTDFDRFVDFLTQQNLIKGQQQYNTVSALRNYIHNYSRYAQPFKELYNIFRQHDFPVSDRLANLLSSSRFFAGDASQIMFSDDRDEARQAVRLAVAMQNIQTNLYGYASGDVETSLQQIRSTLLELSNNDQYRRSIEEWFNQHQITLQSIIETHKNNPEIRRRFAQGDLMNINTFINKAEKLVNRHGEIVPVADLIKTTMGLKGKQATGIVVDTLLQSFKSFSSMTSEQQQTLQLGESFFDFLNSGGTDEDLNRFFRTLEQSEAVSSDLIDSVQFREQLRHMHRAAPQWLDVNAGELQNVNIQDFLNIADHYQSQIGDSHLRSKFTKVMHSLLGSLYTVQPQRQLAHDINLYGKELDQTIVQPALKKLQDTMVDAYYKQITWENRESIQAIAANLQQVVGVDLGVFNERYAYIMDVAENFFDIQVPHESDIPRGQVTIINELLNLTERINDNGQDAIALFNSLREYEFRFGTEFAKVMALDTQKTVEKDNTKVILSTILSSIVNNERYKETDDFLQKINNQLYNALARGNSLQFNQAQIYDLIRQNRDNLQRLGFSRGFINFFENFSGNTNTFIRQMQNAQQVSASDFQALTRLLYEEMRRGQETIVTNKEIPHSFKEAVAFAQMRRYIDIGATLISDSTLNKTVGTGQAAEEARQLRDQYAQLLYRSIVGFSLSEIMQQEASKAVSRQLLSNLTSDMERTYRQFDNLIERGYSPDIQSTQKNKFMYEIQKTFEISKKQLNKEQTNLYNQLIEKMRQLAYVKEQIDRGEDPGNVSVAELRRQIFSNPILDLSNENARRKLAQFMNMSADELEKQKVKSLKKLPSFINKQELRYQALKNSINNLYEKQESSMMLIPLTRAKLYVDIVGRYQETSYAGKIQISYLQQDQVDKYTDVYMKPFDAFQGVTDLQRPRFLREPKDKKLTRTAISRSGFGDQLTGGSYGKYRQLIQTRMYQHGMDISDALPAEFKKQTRHLVEDITEEEERLYREHVKKTLEEISLEDEGEDASEQYEELQAVRKGMLMKAFHTGVVIPFASTQSGGLFITPSASNLYYDYNLDRAMNVQEKVFDSPKIALSAMKTKLGWLTPEFAEYMYKPSQLGLPIGTYTTVNANVKSNVFFEIRRQFALKAYGATRTEITTLKQFDIQRQQFLSSKYRERYPELRYILEEVFNQRELIDYLQTNRIDANRAPLDVLRPFLENRIRELGIAEIQQHLPEIDLGETPQSQMEELIRHITEQLPEPVTRLRYAMAQKYNIDALDIKRTTDYLLTPHRLQYEDVEMWLVPHQLVDAISVSSPNQVGATVSLKPYGHYATPIQERFNPAQAGTDSIRAITTFGTNAPQITFDTQNTTDEIVKEIVEINRKREEYLLDVRIPDVFAGQSQTETIKEMKGILVPMLVVDKDTEDVHRFLEQQLGTHLNFAGDQIFMYKPLLESMRYVTRGPFGELQYKYLPENTKWSGVARSKGVATLLFDRQLSVSVGNQVIPIGGIINMQGKRKNKMAEFIMGAMRIHRYLGKRYRRGIRDLTPIDVTDLSQLRRIAERAGSISNNRNLFIKPLGELHVEGAATGIQARVILMKLYNYAGKSHSMTWTEISNLSPQVLPQLKLFRQSGLVSLMLNADRREDAVEGNVMLTNATSTTAEGAQAGAIQHLIEKNYVRYNKTKGRSVAYAAGIRKARYIGLNRAFDPYIKTFGSIKRKQRTISSARRLQYMSEQLRSSKIYDQRLRRTSELLQILSETLENPYITLDTGTTVRQISRQQAEALQNFAGSEVLVPAIGIDYLRTLTKNQRLGGNDWSIFREVDELVRIAEERGNVITLNQGNNALRFIRMRMPKLSGYTGYAYSLTLEAETLANMYQGVFSVLHQAATGDKKRLVSSFKFYASRQLSLGNIETRQFVRKMYKKHGMQIQGAHATARKGLGGVGAPDEQFKVLFASAVRQKQLDITDIYNSLSTEDQAEIEFLQVTDEEDTKRIYKRWKRKGITISEQRLNRLRELKGTQKLDSLFSRWASQVVIVDKGREQDQLRFFIDTNQEQFTNPQEIRELIFSNVPIFKPNLRARVIAYNNQFQFRQRVAIKALEIYSQLKSNPLIKPKQPTKIIDEFQGGKSTEILYDSQLSEQHGEMWGYLQRHPIIGHTIHTRIATISQNNTIDVPQHVAEQIAGDDDGDIINLLPYILIENEVFTSGAAEVTKYGTFGLTMADIRSVEDHSQLGQELSHMLDIARQYNNQAGWSVDML